MKSLTHTDVTHYSDIVVVAVVAADVATAAAFWSALWSMLLPLDCFFFLRVFSRLLLVRPSVLRTNQTGGALIVDVYV